MAYYVCGCEWRSSTSTGCTGQCLISRTGEHFAGFSHALPASSSTGVVETKVGGTRVCNTPLCLLSDMTVAGGSSFQTLLLMFHQQVCLRVVTGGQVTQLTKVCRGT